VNRKPGKDNDTQLKAYRSISLLSCMGNVVENVVAELLSEEAKRRGLLSDGKFGSRSRRSAIDAVAILVGRAHAAWRDSHIASVLFMDIKAAFLLRGFLVPIINTTFIELSTAAYPNISFSPRLILRLNFSSFPREHST